MRIGKTKIFYSNDDATYTAKEAMCAKKRCILYTTLNRTLTSMLKKLRFSPYKYAHTNSDINYDDINTDNKY